MYKVTLSEEEHKSLHTPGETDLINVSSQVTKQINKQTISRSKLVQRVTAIYYLKCLIFNKKYESCK